MRCSELHYINSVAQHHCYSMLYYIPHVISCTLNDTAQRRIINKCILLVTRWLLSISVLLSSAESGACVVRCSELHYVNNEQIGWSQCADENANK